MYFRLLYTLLNVYRLLVSSLKNLKKKEGSSRWCEFSWMPKLSRLWTIDLIPMTLSKNITRTPTTTREGDGVRCVGKHGKRILSIEVWPSGKTKSKKQNRKTKIENRKTKIEFFPESSNQSNFDFFLLTIFNDHFLYN